MSSWTNVNDATVLASLTAGVREFSNENGCFILISHFGVPQHSEKLFTNSLYAHLHVIVFLYVFILLTLYSYFV